MPYAGLLSGRTSAVWCKSLVISGFLLLSSALLAQPPTPALGAVLKGTIVLNSEAGKGLAKIAITADGAKPVVSQRKGQFQLVFPAKQPGDSFQLRVNRPGWRVVNAVQLTGYLPEANAAGLEIILAKEDEFERYAQEFYRSKAEAAIKQSYALKLAGLEADAAAIERLNQERDQALKQANMRAYHFATDATETTTNTTNSQRHQEATRAFFAGNLDAALQLLDESQFKANMAQLHPEQKSRREELAQELLLRGELLTFTLNAAAAKQAYQNAIGYFRYSAYAWFRYAAFLDEQNADQDAVPAYQSALYLYRQLADDEPQVYLPEVARTLNSLGIVLLNEHQRPEARKAMEESVEVYRQLAKANPKVYLSHLAETLNILGVVYSGEERTAKARRAFEESLAIYKDLYARSPRHYHYKDDVDSLKYNLEQLDH